MILDSGPDFDAECTSGSSSPSTYSPVEPTGSPGGTEATCRKGDKCKNANLRQILGGVTYCCPEKCHCRITSGKCFCKE